jgi:hypothetical protein
VGNTYDPAGEYADPRQVHEHLLETATKEEVLGLGDEINFLGGKIDGMDMELLDIKKKLEDVIYRHELEVLKDRVAVIEKVIESIKKR